MPAPVAIEPRGGPEVVPIVRLASPAEPDLLPEPGPTWRPPPRTADTPNDSSPPITIEKLPAPRPPSADRTPSKPVRAPTVVGRYAMYDEIESGGMATVHLGRLIGPVGFSRTVAIKRLHARYAKDPDFAAMFLDEARMAARIRHPNVVPTLDVVAAEGELFLVMEYVHGASLAQLVKNASDQGTRIPLPILGHLISGMLQGLHAAHEARSDKGELLGIVHRDVSPQNLLVGLDGQPRLVDFGVAKAVGRISTTQDGRLKGKIGYMSPEQIVGDPLTRRSDIYGVGVVLWHALTGRKPVRGENEIAQIMSVLQTVPEPPSKYAPGLPRKLDSVVLRAMSRDATLRYATAADMAADFEQSTRIATQREVGEWMEQTVGPELAGRAERLAEIESASVQLSAVPTSTEHMQAALDEGSSAEPPAEGPAAAASPSVDAAPRGPASRKRTWIIAGACAALGLGGLGAWYVSAGTGASGSRGASADVAPGVGASAGAATSSANKSQPDSPPSEASTGGSAAGPDAGTAPSATGAAPGSAEVASGAPGGSGKKPPGRTVPAAGTSTAPDKLYVRE